MRAAGTNKLLNLRGRNDKLIGGMNATIPDTKASGLRAFQWLALSASFVLFLALRLPWIGHLLTWDEAMNICSVRAFAAHGHDFYSSWFWRRPPLYSLLLMMLFPQREGFILRAQAFSIAVSTITFFMLFAVNRRVLGVAAALWSVFFLAVMPGAVFFDVWLKQDSLVGIFGLLALLLFLKRRYLYSGLALVFGFLSKELTLFYAIAIGILWVLQPRERRSLGGILLLYLIAAAGAAWWYIIFSNSVKLVMIFMLNAQGTETSVWIQPWYYFFAKMPADVGWLGMGLCLAGLFAFLRESRAGDPELERAWSVALLVPAYVVISLIRGKTPWFVAVLFPALATVQAVGVNGFCRWLSASGRSGHRRAAVAVAMLVVCAAVVGVWGRDYEETLRRQDSGYWWGSNASREAALKLNHHVREGERALITPMFYWDTPSQVPCPIFTCYLKSMPVVVRKYNIPVDDLIADIKNCRIDWVMISPAPAVANKTIIEPLRKKCHLKPEALQGGLIYHTTSLYQSSGPSNSVDKARR